MDRQPLWVPRSVAGGADTAEWTQITSTEQTSDAIVDPNGYTGGTTGVSGGIFTFDINGSVTINNGTREACPKWSVNIEELIPDFDPDTSLVRLAVTDITGLGLGSSTKAGLFTGCFNEDAGNVAALDGGAALIYDFNSGNHGWQIMGFTAPGGGGNKTDFDDAFMTTHWWTKDGSSRIQHTSGQYLTTTADTWGYDAGMHGYSANMGGTPANWSAHLAFHIGATATLVKILGCKWWYHHQTTAGTPV